MGSPAPSTPKMPFANIYFFPLAAAYAVVLLPWSVLGLFGFIWAPPGLQNPLGHAHEMLFGFALAVVTGYLLGPQPKQLILRMVGLWLAARIAFLGWPASWLAFALNSLYVVALGRHVVPRFTGAAKKWRNKTVAPILVGLCAMVLLFHLTQRVGWTGFGHGLLLEAVLLLSALMFFMGGRMIAPAVAGHLQKTKGIELQARVQPRLEGTVLILLGLALMLTLLPWPPARQLAGALFIACAALNFTRMLRWQLWNCLDRPDLLMLALGYLWLVVGWLLTGLALAFSVLPISQALHALTVGALGTLTLTVMGRSRLNRVHGNCERAGALYAGVFLLSLSALLRLMPGTWLPVLASYQFAALTWSLAFGLLLVLLFRLAWQERCNPRSTRRKPASTRPMTDS